MLNRYRNKAQHKFKFRINLYGRMNKCLKIAKSTLNRGAILEGGSFH